MTVANSLTVSGKEVVHAGNISNYIASAVRTEIIEDEECTEGWNYSIGDISSYTDIEISIVGVISGSNVLLATQRIPVVMLNQYNTFVLSYPDLNGGYHTASCTYTASTNMLKIPAVTGTGITTTYLWITGIN